jgi:hypothetical protein
MALCPGVEVTSPKTAHAPQPGPDGTCLVCGHRTADYGQGPMHRRGRVAGQSPFRTYTRAELAHMSFDECEAAGYCECGIRLDQHPEIPRPRPLRSWKSEHAQQLTDDHIDKLIASRTERMRQFGNEPIRPRIAA